MPRDMLSSAMHVHDLRWKEIKQQMYSIHLEYIIMWVWKRENNITWTNKEDQIWKYIHPEYMGWKIIFRIFNISNCLSLIQN